MPTADLLQERARSERLSELARVSQELAKRAAEPAYSSRLCTLLDDPRPDVRAGAASELGRLLGTEGAALAAERARCLHELRGMLDDPDAAVRLAVVGALLDAGGEVRPETVPAALLAELAELLRAADTHVRLGAAARAHVLGPAARALADALLDNLDDGDDGVRFMATAALGSIGAAESHVVAALQARLDDPAEVVRSAAAASLGSLGAAAAPSYERLIALLDEPSEDVFETAMVALAEIEAGEAAASRALAALLRRRPARVWDDPRWLASIGALAARAPHGAPARDAEACLTAPRGEGDLPYGTEVTAALARLACARGDVARATALAPELVDALDEIDPGAEYFDRKGARRNTRRARTLARNGRRSTARTRPAREARYARELVDTRLGAGAAPPAAVGP